MFCESGVSWIEEKFELPYIEVLLLLVCHFGFVNLLLRIILKWCKIKGLQEHNGPYTFCIDLFSRMLRMNFASLN